MGATMLRGAGVEIAADLAGPDGGVPVVLLHGGGQTRFSWGVAGKRLGESGFRSVAVDLRGHGESGWSPDGDYRLDRFVDDLVAVLEDLSAPAFLVGASLGGVTSLVVAGEHRVPIAGLVLVDVAPRIEREGASRITAFMRAKPEGFVSVDEAAEAVAEYLPHRPRPKDTSGLLKNLRLREDGRYHWHWDPRFGGQEVGSSDIANSGERLREAARRLDMPALLVRGGLSAVVSPASVAEFRELAPGAEVADIAGADHMIAGDRNDAFNEVVIDFLHRHASGALPSR